MSIHPLRSVLPALCLALALAASGCATAGSHPGPAASAGAYLDDAATTTAVKALLLGDPDAHLFRIEVTTTQGRVLLEGTVSSRAAEARLLGRIEALQGVRSVRSTLRLEGTPAS